ncbi:MAG: Phosphate import ATP-binding protein PstB [Verrucomicrobiaceae bacterium]|nr:Phosphate import ATP-binding protein PstB [Verrucomicrobiaceae bacterium]
MPSPLITMQNVDFHYPGKQALFDVSMDILPREVTALIGPSGCGKSTVLRCFNRMNDLVPGAKVTKGSIHIAGQDIEDPKLDVINLRRRVGMVFQKSNPFPQSIYDNAAYGLRLQGEKRKEVLDEAVERSLKGSALWDEVKDRLRENAFSLSGGQQQRLCIARSIAVQPEILLMDEPCSALDPIATAKIEELICQLSKDYTIVIVTHNMEQAKRIADKSAYFLLGKLIEMSPTMDLFTQPKRRETERYIRGEVG